MADGRITAWSKHNDNTRLAIAASIFVSAGVVLLYVINLIYAQRIFRAYHPKIGHSKLASNAFKAYFASIVAVLIMSEWLVLKRRSGILLR